uniref:Uncharacterized protein n=1 Tax=Rhizophora mucronata TaxID=61149 RepID=A0A2P2N9L9_RHIMU
MSKTLISHILWSLVSCVWLF